MRNGILFVVSGPAGSGKGTVVRKIIEKHPEIKLSISATTRNPRPEDEEGVTYFFISKDEFKRKIENDEFFEYNYFTGNDNYYGTPKAAVNKQLAEGKDVILEIDVNGAMQIKEKCSEVVTIMLTPPDVKTLERRLAGRNTESKEEILKRLDTAKKEMELLPKYDYSVVNEDGKADECADLIYSIITAEHQKTTYTKSIMEKFI